MFRLSETREIRSDIVMVEDMSCRLAANCRSSGCFSYDAISEVPLDRWDVESTGEAIVGGRFGGFVSQWAEFDAAVFGISTAEAAYLDPAQRILLEVSQYSILRYLIPRCLTEIYRQQLRSHASSHIKINQRHVRLDSTSHLQVIYKLN